MTIEAGEGLPQPAPTWRERIRHRLFGHRWGAVYAASDGGRASDCWCGEVSCIHDGPTFTLVSRRPMGAPQPGRLKRGTGERVQR